MTETDIIGGMIERAEGRIAELHVKMQMEERYLAELREKRHSLNASDDTQISSQPNGSLPKRKVKRAVIPGGLAAHIIAVLEVSGNPLKLAEIAERVSARGVTTEVERGIEVVVQATLARLADLFKKISRGVYTLRGHQAKKEPNADGG